MASEYISSNSSADAASHAPLSREVATDPAQGAARRRGQFFQFVSSLGHGPALLWVISLVVSIASILWVGRVLFAESLGLRVPDLHFNRTQPGLISLHGVIGTVALLIGPIQMSAWLRVSHPQLHRMLGRIYVVTAVITSISALGLAPKTDYLGLTYAFPVGSVICLVCTLLGFAAIYNGDVTAHRRWMLRSYAALWISPSFRLYYNFLSSVFDPDFSPKYAFAFWLSCLTNLIVVELVLRRSASFGGVARSSPAAG